MWTHQKSSSICVCKHANNGERPGRANWGGSISQRKEIRNVPPSSLSQKSVRLPSSLVPNLTWKLQDLFLANVRGDRSLGKPDQNY